MPLALTVFFKDAGDRSLWYPHELSGGPHHDAIARGWLRSSGAPLDGLFSSRSSHSGAIARIGMGPGDRSLSDLCDSHLYDALPQSRLAVMSAAGYADW